MYDVVVLNLIITGIPSILKTLTVQTLYLLCFKPYYNWNTFNTYRGTTFNTGRYGVLNLIITGIPSIL